MNIHSDSWYKIDNADEVDSPSLLIYPDRVKENVRRMIAIAGSADRLCPHVKTHKLAPLIQIQMELGISKFKCSTIAEAEMVANCGAPDVVLAYQPVGPKLARFIQLCRQFPKTKFSALADNETSIRAISEAATREGMKLSLLLDIDCGMQRTGIPAGTEARILYQLMSQLPGIEAAGLHVYDGHIADSAFKERQNRCNSAFAPADQLRAELINAGIPVPRVIAGGTPTFPIHALRTNVECSPGTCVLWDAGYGTKCPDLNFVHAALVITRVISKPGHHRVCVDLGHKAIAAENPHPRVFFLNLSDAKAVMHSEEHLVLETSEDLPIGKVLYGVPWHICPTVALYSHAVAVRNQRAEEVWKIEARSRKLSV